MAFHLTARDRIGKGLARVVKKELRKAIGKLEQSQLGSDTIHQARKHVKKLRAICRLVKPAAGKPVRRADKRLRRIGHRLSPLRDLDMMKETLAHVLAQQPDRMLTRAVALINSRLDARRRREHAHAFRTDLKGSCEKAFRKVKRLTKRWRFDKVGKFTIRDGVGATYRAAGEAMDVAREGQRAADFHEWRKQVKALWFQLRLLEKRADLSEQLENLRRLEELLGEDHDLAVLEAYVRHQPVRIIHRRHMARLKAECRTYHRHLRQNALTLGRHVFVARPKALTEALRDAA